MKDKQATLFDAAFETGLSGTWRLHDLFINIEGMTPGEFKNGGENPFINTVMPKVPSAIFWWYQLIREFVIWLFPTKCALHFHTRLEQAQ